MPSSVTPQFLLEGAAYALEQCGLLLRDANLLYRSGSYANTIVLAAFAREELGRSAILLDLRRDVLNGSEYTIKDIRFRCGDHVAKQKAGMLSIVLKGPDLGNILRTRMQLDRQSAEWKRADEDLKKIINRWRKHVPGNRHKNRTSALYVEPVSRDNWNRPVETSGTFAHEFLQDSVNDYAGRYHQGYITSEDPILRLNDPELYTALQEWSARPILPPPEWPPFPTW